MLSRFQFNTIGLFTTNNAKVVRFYCDIFGFQIGTAKTPM